MALDISKWHSRAGMTGAANMEVILHFVLGREVWGFFVRPDLGCLLVQLLGHGVLVERNLCIDGQLG